MSVQATEKPLRLDPCPAEERVAEYYDTIDGYQPTTKQLTDRNIPDDTGITFERCGGGRRIIRKKIGGS